MIRLEINNCNMILTEKQQSILISALSSGKIDKYEYLTGEEILPSDQRRIIEQSNQFTFFPLGKAFKKQTKTNEDHGIKQAEAFKALKAE